MPTELLTARANDIAGLTTAIVNVYFVGEPGNWVLVDAGMPMSGGKIEAAARKLFGGSPPNAIVMTHGHFDHVGALKQLAEKWDVPVLAHEMEMPYLQGKSKYPPPDPTVGGGLMARSANLYPRGPINLGNRVRALPEDNSIPGMDGWRWVPTPGHSPGHVSFFRDQDRAVIAGDAFVTTKQESLSAVMSQRLEVHGPPMYFTPDYQAAWDSVRRLVELEPEIAYTGHGRPIEGQYLRDNLLNLVQHFEEIAIPKKGRYVGRPARADRDGVTYVPPPVFDPVPIVAAAVLGAVILKSTRGHKTQDE